jgi:hypothetical protein
MSKFCVDIDFVRTHIDALELQRVVEIEHLAIELSMEFPEKAWDFNEYRGIEIGRSGHETTRI